MSERPATRADLRSGAWQGILYGAPRDSAGVQGCLKLLAALDAEEAGDPAGARYVAVALKRLVVVTSSDQRAVGFRLAAPEHFAPAWPQARLEPGGERRER